MKEQTSLKLNIELVPRTSWRNNVRSKMPERWKEISRQVNSSACDMCQICGGISTSLHAHEQWSYDECTGIQTLVGIIAICSSCHSVTHIGLAQIQGKFEQAKQHFLLVNCVCEEVFQQAFSEAKARFNRHSQIDWKIDISCLEKLNYKKEK